MNVDNNIGCNKISQNNTIQSNSWNTNVRNDNTQQRKWALNPISSVLGQNRTIGTSNNNIGSIFGYGQNRKPKKNEQIYRRR